MRFHSNNPIRFVDPDGHDRIDRTVRDLVARLNPILRAWHEAKDRYDQFMDAHNAALSIARDTFMPAPLRDSDETQEGRARNYFRDQGYILTGGVGEGADTKTQAALQLQGQSHADVVGMSDRNLRWVIAESKGGELEKATSQISASLTALLNISPTARGRVDAFVYVSKDVYERLHRGEHNDRAMDSEGYLRRWLEVVDPDGTPRWYMGDYAYAESKTHGEKTRIRVIGDSG